MGQGSKPKKGMKRKDLLINERTLTPHDDNTEEQYYRRKRDKEQGSVTVLHLRNKQQSHREQQRQGRSNSPPARMKVTRHL